MPETFLPTCDVEFTTPLAIVSNTVVRSVSIEQHEDPDRVEKYVRYVAKCQYKLEIDYVQCADLDMEAVMDTTNTNPEKCLDTLPDAHKPAIDTDAVKEAHTGTGYRIDFSDAELGGGRFDGGGRGLVEGGGDSSSDDDDQQHRRSGAGRGGKMPIIQIDMKDYGY